MADRFYSVVLGEGLASQVTEGASTSGEAIELRVSDSIYSNKLAVIIGVEAIEQYLATTETNPIA
jgi:hypothetical protein